MKPIQTTVTEINNMPGEEVEFTISQEAAHLIMQSMADLYSNRSLATIREYSTNAHDSHIEAGKPDLPIDVTLPNELHPYFSVRDYGVGMSATELKQVYTSFGASTRRVSDDFNGTYGYGSKSALAYTNSFTITAVKDGKKAIGVVTRKDNGVMVLKEVVNADTIDPNGVTIEVPVNNIAEFNQIAMEFYEFWPQGTVNVNGKPVENPYTDKLDDNLYRNVGAEGKSFVVMGNVAYPVNNPSSLYPTSRAYQPFVAYVPNGTVEFVPSREALKYTDHTNRALQNIVDSYLANVKALADKEVSTAANKWEALRFSRKWHDILGTSFKYKGKDIPTKIPFTGRVWHTYRTWNPVERTSTAWGGEIDLNKDVLIIVDATSTVGTYHRERMKRWKSTDLYPKTLNNSLPSYVYWTEASSFDSDGWINPAHIVSWNTVKAQTPPPPRAAAGSRVKGSFDVVEPSGKVVTQKTITDAKLWVDTQWIKRKRNYLFDLVSEFDIKNDIVIVPYNRQNKFFRDFPKAVRLGDHFNSLVDLDGDAMYNEEQRIYFSLSYSEKNALENLDPSRIDDKELKQLVIVANKKLDRPPAYEINRKRASLLGLSFKAFNSKDLKIDKLMGKYPLLHWGLNYLDKPEKIEHFYVYINACVQARKDGTLVR